jgi:hypothetical protein
VTPEEQRIGEALGIPGADDAADRARIGDMLAGKDSPPPETTTRQYREESYGVPYSEFQRQRDEAEGFAGLPGAGRIGELGRQGLITGTAGLINTAPNLLALALKGLSVMTPESAKQNERLEALAAGAERFAERGQRATEWLLRGQQPSPMEPSAPEQLPEVLPPQNKREEVFFRGAEFIPELMAGRGIVKGLGLAAEAVPVAGLAGKAGKTLRTVATDALQALGLGSASVLGEWGGESLGGETGGAVGRIAGELFAGQVTQPAVRAGGERAVQFAERAARAGARRLMTVGGREATFAEAEDVLGKFFNSRAAKRIMTAMTSGDSTLPREAADAAQAEFARISAERVAQGLEPLEIKIDLATRYGTKSLMKIRGDIEKASPEFLNQMLRLKDSIDKVYDATRNSLLGPMPEGGLQTRSKDELDTMSVALDARLSQLEEQRTKIVDDLAASADPYHTAGQELRTNLANARRAAINGYSVKYATLDQAADEMAAQLPAGGYDISPVMNWVYSQYGDRNTFAFIHRILTKFDQRAKSYVLRGKPDDALPSPFPPLMTPAQIDEGMPWFSLNADDVNPDDLRGIAAESTRDGQPAPDRPIDPGTQWEPVDFSTLRGWHREINTQLRRPGLSGQEQNALRELKKQVELLISTDTPEAWKAFQAVNTGYRNDVVGRYYQGFTGLALKEGKLGYTTHDRALLSALVARGAPGARQAMEAGLDVEFLNRAARQSLLRAFGKRPATPEAVDAWMRENRAFLQAYGADPTNFRDQIVKLDDDIKLARLEDKALNREVLSTLMKTSNPSGALIEVFGNPLKLQELVSLTRNSAPFRKAVISELGSVLETVMKKTNMDVFAWAKRNERALSDLLNTPSNPDAYRRFLGLSAMMQVRKQMDPTQYPMANEANKTIDEFQERFGQSPQSVQARARAVQMGYMSLQYAITDIAVKYGLNISMKKALEMQERAMLDPDFAQELEKFVTRMNIPNLPAGSAGKVVEDFRKYALQNNIAVILYETGELAGGKPEYPKAERRRAE